jgi:hypothetical protein
MDAGIVLNLAFMALSFLWEYRAGLVVVIALIVGVDALRTIAWNFGQIVVQLAEIKSKPRRHKHGIEPIAHLAAIRLEESRMAHRCAECGALPNFRANLELIAEAGKLNESSKTRKGHALSALLLLGGNSSGAFWEPQLA